MVLVAELERAALEKRTSLDFPVLMLRMMACTKARKLPGVR
jgi:hypothetical protein